MAVQFKFRGFVNFESAAIDGHAFIFVRDLKSRIIRHKNLNLCQDSELVFSDAVTSQGRIEMILKAQNGSKTVARFEEYKESVKAQCVADRNEIMQFQCLGPASSGVTVYDAYRGMWGFHGKKKEKKK
ncbi:hypothetical protein ACFX19_034971 [Malus domestica]